MRKNKKTITLAKIRRYIRQAINWSKVDNGMSHFYSHDNYKISSLKIYPETQDKNYPYYSKTTKAIEEIAEKIYDIVEDEIFES